MDGLYYYRMEGDKTPDAMVICPACDTEDLKENKRFINVGACLKHAPLIFPSHPNCATCKLQAQYIEQLERRLAGLGG